MEIPRVVLQSDQTSAAIGRAIQTWQDVKCSRVPLVDRENADGDIGFAQFVFPEQPGVIGGSPVVQADVQFGGFLPQSFFDAVDNTSNSTRLSLGYTFVFIDDSNGLPNPLEQHLS